jgi:molybdate transport system substrate-binding protein
VRAAGPAPAGLPPAGVPLVGHLAAVLVGTLLVGLVGGCVTAGSPGSASTDVSPGSGPGTALTVAAAADLRYAMDEIAAAYHEAHPDTTVSVTYGSSGNFYSQISNGAPFDVYFSADADYPRRLERTGLADPGSTRSYAVGRLAVWAPPGSPLDVSSLGLKALTDPRARTVAIANPEHAPYGRAAVAAMKSAGVYDAVAGKLVLGENASQAAQFVDTGSADVGVLALSLVLAPPLAGRGEYALVPADLHPPIEQGAVVLRRAANHAIAVSFLDFVLGSEGRAVLDRYGFGRPGS